MSQLRWDPLKKSWVVITRSPGRGPHDYFREREEPQLEICPFCYGQETRTPHEVFALRPDGGAVDTPGWRVRVIPNKYPVLRIEGNLEIQEHGLYESMDGVGAHEIIIENPDHGRHLAQLSTAEILDVLRAWRARLLDLRRDPRFRYLLVFKNHGIEAGAGIPHSHCQLIALPITPPVLTTELDACRDYHQRHARCLVCDLLDQELREGERIIRNDGRFLVFSPFAAAAPFEVRIMPLQHGHDFALLDDQALESLAAALGDTLLRLFAVLHDPPYNFILHNAPPMHLPPEHPDYWESLARDYHWHLEVVPRLTRVAGFERGTGFYMNPTPPEMASRHLRDADLSLYR